MPASLPSQSSRNRQPNGDPKLSKILMPLSSIALSSHPRRPQLQIPTDMAEDPESTLISDGDRLISALQTCFGELLKKQEEQGDRLYRAVEALKPPVPAGDKKTAFWNSYMKLADEYDKEFQQKYSTDLDTALIFQWIMYYQAAGSRGSIEQRGLERQRKLDGLIKWKFDAVLQLFPLLLQLALLLFACSLSVYLSTVNHAISTIVIILTSCGLIAYFFLLTSAAIYPDSPFQTPLTPLAAHLVSPALQFLRFIRVQVHTSGKKILSATFANQLLPRFAEKVSVLTAAAKDPNVGVPVPGASPEVPALLWVLGTSTDPTTIAPAAEMAVDIQWPIKLDLRPTGTALARVADTFQSCFDFDSSNSPSQAVRPGMENIAIACGRIYCSLRHNIRATNLQNHFNPYLLLDRLLSELELTTGTALDDVLGVIQERVHWNVKWEESSHTGHNWVLYVLPSLRPASSSLGARVYMFFTIIADIPSLDIIGFTNYLCCVCALFASVDTRLLVLMDKSNWRDYLLTCFLNDLQSATTDATLVLEVIRATAELAQKCTTNGDRRSNLLHSLQLFQAVSQFRPPIPKAKEWAEIVITASQLARIGNVRDLRGVYSLVGPHIHLVNPEHDVHWIYLALEHVHQSLIEQTNTDSTDWDQDTILNVDSLMQVLACGSSHIFTPPVECLDLILRALSSDRREITFTALLVLHRAQDWFSNPDLRPHMQRHSIVHHLNLLARRFTPPMLPVGMDHGTRVVYLERIHNIATQPEWKPSLFAELSTWIGTFSFNSSEQEDYACKAFISITRSIWAPDFDDKQWQPLSPHGCCVAVTFGTEALSNTWATYDFTAASAVQNFLSLARCTAVTVLSMEGLWAGEDLEYRPVLPSRLLPVFSSRLCQSLRQAATNSRNSSPSVAGPGSSLPAGRASLDGIAQFLEHMAERLITTLPPDTAVLGNIIEENGPWFNLRGDLLQEIYTLEQSFGAGAGHD
ncbi:hypothetical protein C8R46DRAFT_1317386 [Mycena filopes]|nr:hypothetical protein C8R46DRAFT_1317386 [Mycena filopes]